MEKFINQSRMARKVVQDNNELAKEIETKFDIPLAIDRDLILLQAGDIAARTGWILKGSLYEALHFLYFDTPALDVYRNGETIRRVDGFPAQSQPLARFRYDLKVGPVHKRMEKNAWHDLAMNPTDLGWNLPYRAIQESAFAHTNHLKFFFEKSGTLVEISLDDFVVLEGTPFRELEIELKEGDARLWQGLISTVEAETRLAPGLKQKYTRIIEGMPKYRDLIK